MRPLQWYVPLAIYEFAERTLFGRLESNICVAGDSIESVRKVALNLLRPDCGMLVHVSTKPNPRRVEINEGKLCAYCSSRDIECEGAIPDGINLNALYRCKTCNGKWEEH